MSVFFRKYRISYRWDIDRFNLFNVECKFRIINQIRVPASATWSGGYKNSTLQVVCQISMRLARVVFLPRVVISTTISCRSNPIMFLSISHILPSDANTSFDIKQVVELAKDKCAIYNGVCAL